MLLLIILVLIPLITGEEQGPFQYRDYYRNIHEQDEKFEVVDEKEDARDNPRNNGGEHYDDENEEEEEEVYDGNGPDDIYGDEGGMDEGGGGLEVGPPAPPAEQPKGESGQGELANYRFGFEPGDLPELEASDNYGIDYMDDVADGDVEAIPSWRRRPVPEKPIVVKPRAVAAPPISRPIRVPAQERFGSVPLPAPTTGDGAASNQRNRVLPLNQGPVMTQPAGQLADGSTTTTQSPSVNPNSEVMRAKKDSIKQYQEARKKFVQSLSAMNKPLAQIMKDLKS